MIMYHMFCTIAIFCVFVRYVFFFFKNHRKSLSEPGVSCSTFMSLVCIAASLVFEQNDDDDDDDIIQCVYVYCMAINNALSLCCTCATMHR